MKGKDKQDNRELYEQIIDEYLLTNSVKQVVENLNTNTIKVRRVLITEGLWESDTSRKVGALNKDGKRVKEIAEELCMSEKNVQSYLPYTRGAYGGEKSSEAERCDIYRNRMRQAAGKQVSLQELDDKGLIISDMSEKKIIVFPGKENTELAKRNESNDRLPCVYKLRFELVAPYFSDNGLLDMMPEEEKEFLKLAKAEKGIIREVLVHCEMNLHAIHYMIQRLFGWQNSHLHHFSLSKDDFEAVSNGNKVKDYMNLCGSLFVFPGAELNDQFWDDDYSEGKSIKSWLRSKYDHGFRDYSVENSFIMNDAHVLKFMEENKNEFRKKNKNFDDPDFRYVFENDFNTVIEGLPVCEIFKTGGYGKGSIIDCHWKEEQDEIIREARNEYDNQ